MNSKFTVYWGFLLLFLIQTQVRAKPTSSLQSLANLLDELSQHLGSEEMDREREERTPADSSDQIDSDVSWERNSRNFMEGSPSLNNKLGKILRDIMTSSKRSWGRSKKGSLRSCFGVKLDRIGSMSGLGC
ncbi:C-type natriuretic peptide-like [Latimeria chalumnae]|uniref:C-type natriuretic peptide 3 n=1 Tax=Latimeria chalumnae TaxID=7897 RepID=H3AI27_LATCH|nr:PREDICTED: C-type natriuretic peptide-like [Latimeria chalumnae]|eukprot:XP_005996657.1 PREDICTED: C-type natriuretic peptide-like [Latimeria chalumnae]